MDHNKSVLQPLLEDYGDDKEAFKSEHPAAQPQRRRDHSRARRIVLRVLVWGSLWYIFLFYVLVGTHKQWARKECTRNAWIMEAFAPKKPEIPIGRLAENFFLTIPNSASAIAASRQYATKPHLAGSDGDLQTAEDFLHLLQRELNVSKPREQAIFPAGSEASRNATLSITNLTEPTAWIDVYYPVMNTPLDRSLEILSDDGEVVWSAELEEVADETDGDAWTYFDAVPTWHGLSRGGEVQGKLIDVNYGLKSDYDALVEKGVNFTGAIAIARYGRNFRGLKIKAAQELGAAGVLIYSDPRDDGTVTELNNYTAYPHGPARNPTSVQRGSVQFLSIYPGDPTTPGYPAYENSTRTNGTNIPSIPSLPISWANAKVLLKELGGKNRVVKLVNHVDTKVTPIWNPMGVIPGHIKDEVVVIGNHRDAWVLGATDPTSGTVSVHEVVRGFGALLREGWKPLRTIVIASWDAEEYGLIGSTEWGEDFADWIQKHVVAYLNLDSSVSGSRFGAQASPSLAHFIRETAEELPHPTDPLRTLWDARKDTGVLFGEHQDAEALALDIEAEKAADVVGVSPLGSGSDFTVFLQRLGIASLSSGFGSTRQDPVYHYHSVFDSERWQEVYGDPGFVKHVAVAKHLGLQALRLANAIILPFNTTHYAFELENYLEKVEELALTSSVDTNFVPLRASIKALQIASRRLDIEKDAAERTLKHILAHWKKHPHFPHHHSHHPHHPKPPHHPDVPNPPDVPDLPDFPRLPHLPDLPDRPALPHHPHHRHGAKTAHRHHSSILHRVGRFLHKCKNMFNRNPATTRVSPDAIVKVECGRPTMPRLGRGPALVQEQNERPGKESHTVSDEGVEVVEQEKPHRPHLPHPKVPHRPHWPHWPHWPHKPKKGPKHPPPGLIRAIKEVRKINHKLASFERGFIHEDGIKDREWYRHLGVAPGKWLGYGATTLPALTEAITIEKNSTLANYEAERLRHAIDKIAATLHG
ncbi:Zn-dependent exopeptidase [Artomyces pyxidatus]|uniref:Zn-dependent exopeptidase n=1 Tax=Artomyces pyxidatus TaxID=48021 RepID=A0ACB8TJK7_9AGAM|nr:Zn-dependent exopeptidase [Artomyces pyxidatus]